MKRIATILAVFAVLASDAGAGTKVDRPRAKHSWEDGWWSSWRPTTRSSNVVARPVGEPVVTSNVAQEKRSGTTVQPATVPETAKAESAEKKPARAVKRTSRTKSARRASPPPTSDDSAPSREETASGPQDSAEAKWWETDGNPAVFAFSNCVASYAATAVKAGSQASHPEFVTQAMAGPCKGEFDVMAALLLKHHGEKGFAKVSRELIDTTFIPAVKRAIDSVTAETPAQQGPNKELLAKELQTAKDRMFDCFVRETDRLAVSNFEPDVVGEAVISACLNDADMFFAKLEELYPDTSAGARANKQTALSESYLPAILTRLSAVRAAKVGQQ